MSNRPGISAGQILGPLRYLFSFQGRINRTQYWIFWVILIGAFFAWLVIYSFLGGMAFRHWTPVREIMVILMGATTVAFLVFATTSCAMIHIKRLHDRDKTGLLVLVALIPLVGTAWVLVQCGFLKGTEGPNRYDKEPSGEMLAEVFE